MVEQNFNFYSIYCSNVNYSLQYTPHIYFNVSNFIYSPFKVKGFFIEKYEYKPLMNSTKWKYFLLRFRPCTKHSIAKSQNKFFLGLLKKIPVINKPNFVLLFSF